MLVSLEGGGAFIDFNGDCVCHKGWTANESSKSTAWRELSVIEFSLQSFASLLEGSHVKWYTDSQAAAKVIVEVGSMSGYWFPWWLQKDFLASKQDWRIWRIVRVTFSRRPLLIRLLLILYKHMAGCSVSGASSARNNFFTKNLTLGK